MKTLRLFCDVVALNSFSRAAERHRLTQPAVSQRIRQLEETLGTTLLDRSVRPFVTTPAGELLSRKGSDLVEALDSLLDEVAQLQGELQGTVRVDAIYSAGIALLHQLRQQFAEREPAVEVTFEFKRPEEVAESVRRRSCDLGIVSYPRSWREVKATHLRDELMCVACSPRHPLANRSSVHARDLASVPLTGFGADLPVGRDIRRYLRKQGVRPTFEHQVDNIDTMVSLLVESDGVAILPERTVIRELEAGTLTTLVLRPRHVRPLGIVQPRRGRLKPAAQAFRTFLLERASTAGTGARAQPAWATAGAEDDHADAEPLMESARSAGVLP